MQAHPITRKLEQTSQVLFIIYAAVSAFCLYTCIFALRKTFGVATYEGLSYWGIDYKILMVTFQVIGYLISKFIGIKVVSELQSKYRTRGYHRCQRCGRGGCLPAVTRQRCRSRSASPLIRPA